MIEYNVVRSNALPVVSQDFITIIGAEDHSWGIVEVDATGANGSSVYTELGIYLVTVAGTTPGGAITPRPSNVLLPAAALLVYTTWSVQPTVGTLLDTIPLNGNGGRFLWRPTSLSKAIWMKGGNDATSTISIRPITINGNTTLKLKLAEI